MALPSELVLDATEARLAGVTVLLDWLLVHHPKNEPIVQALDCINQARMIIRDLAPTV